MNNTEYELIKKLLKERNLECLDCYFLKFRSYQDVLKILNMPEWQEAKFQGLLTPSIWNSNYEKIQKILAMPEWNEDKYQDLLTSSIWQSNYEEIQKILAMPEWNEEKFQGLLTSSIWQSNYQDIKEKLSLEYWQNPLYEKLLTPSIWTISTQKIKEAISLFEREGLESYININVMRKSKKQIKALINYCKAMNISIIKDEKLNPIFNVPASILLKKYGLNLDKIVRYYGEVTR